MGSDVSELEGELLPVLDGDAPALREAVGEADSVELPESVLEGVMSALPEPLTVGEPVCVPVGLMDGLVLLE